MTTDQEWNEQIKQHNVEAIAKAQKLHDLKQAAAQKVIEANRLLIRAYSDDGELIDFPESLNEATSLLGKAIRQLKTKERIELLGQDADVFKVTLPDWAEAK